ncbi:MAG: ABC transporter permease [Deltaproteobacteria bacterium]|nr:ABC transporter permease [Deltaproteobacteria bacterium]
MWIFSLALKSIKNRKFITSLTILSIALSVGLFLSVEQIRRGARESFSNTISKTDLIVGTKGGSIQLLLYSVFHMGSATNNLLYKSYEKIKANPAIEWTIPYSLGDSHRGYRVVGTTEDFYKFYKFRQDKSVEFESGNSPSGIFDVAIGAEVAKNLNYQVGRKIILSHGISEGASIYDHGDKPFTITGVLKRTGTPIDRAIYITLEGMEAIHIDWQNGVPPSADEMIHPDKIKKQNLPIGQITAFLVRCKSRIEVLKLQREIDAFKGEPLMAIIPGVTLSELWRGIGYAEEALKAVSLLVIAVGFLGMLVSLYTTLNERRREMAILRAIGARPVDIIALLVFESGILSALGVLLGVIFVYAGLFIFQPILENSFNLYLPIQMLSNVELTYLLVIVGAGFLIGLIPALKAYRNALADGLSTKI